MCCGVFIKRNSNYRWCRLYLREYQMQSSTATITYWHMMKYSRSISFFSWWRTQCRVDDCGHPISVFRQHEQTEASRVKARHSETLDLPGMHERRSSSSVSSVSKSVWYSIKYALINTASSISTGRSLTDVYSNITCTFLNCSLSVVSNWFIQHSLYTKQAVSYLAYLRTTYSMIKYGNILSSQRKFTKCVVYVCVSGYYQKVLLRF